MHTTGPLKYVKMSMNFSWPCQYVPYYNGPSSELTKVMFMTYYFSFFCHVLALVSVSYSLQLIHFILNFERKTFQNIEKKKCLVESNENSYQIHEPIIMKWVLCTEKFQISLCIHEVRLEPSLAPVGICRLRVSLQYRMKTYQYKEAHLEGQ